MDLVESERQITQMISFILNEAKDKSEELESRAIEEFNVEKLKLVQSQKKTIRDEFTFKLKQAETQSAISRSTAINNARLKKSEARHECLMKLKGLCTQEMTRVINEKTRYTELLANLICQGALKLLEDQVVIKCCKDDEAQVKQACDMAAANYNKIIKGECKVDKRVSFQISKSGNLPKSCGGGIVLTTSDGKISIDNTLATRLSLVMDTEIPIIRKTLFS